METRDGPLGVDKPRLTLLPFYDSLGFQCGWMWKNKPELAALLYMLPEEGMPRA